MAAAFTLPTDLKLKLAIHAPLDKSSKRPAYTVDLSPANGTFTPEEFSAIRRYSITQLGMNFEYPQGAQYIFNADNSVKPDAHLPSPFRFTIRTAEGLDTLLEHFGPHIQNDIRADVATMKAGFADNARALAERQQLGGRWD